MTTNKGSKHKHLTFDERIKIQEMLGAGENFKSIAIELNKDPCTVSKEIRKHILIRERTYTLKDEYGNERNEICDKLTKAPYVCNGCPRKRYCHMEKHLYEARRAHNAYKELLSQAREGIPLTKESFYEIDAIIAEGVKRGQHIYHIVKSNNLDVSLATVYRHLAKGFLSIDPIDLPRKVKFKPRKKRAPSYVPSGIRIGRSHEDFMQFIQEKAIGSWVEMDTVIGAPGGKVILTVDFTFCNFMAAFLLDSKACANVSNVFAGIKRKFRENDMRFGDIIPLVLTDNGNEFSDVNAIELDLDGAKETSVFFCRPMRPSDKPHVEKNHTLFRDICPKGTSFDNFTQDDVNLIFSHVNSIVRKSLGGKSPYDLFSFTYGKKTASLLGIEKIPSREVSQSPLLLKK